jgi:hypothetical protein
MPRRAFASLVLSADDRGCRGAESRRGRRQKCVCSVQEQPRAGTVRSANDLVYAVRAHTGSGAIGNRPTVYDRDDYIADYAESITLTQQARK